MHLILLQSTKVKPINGAPVDLVKINLFVMDHTKVQK